MKKTIYSLFAATLLCVGFTACGDDDDDIKMQDITVNFGTSELGLDDESESAEVIINLSRAHTAALDVTVKVEAEGVEYGEQFTTTPASQDGQIKVTVSAGSTSASFTVSRVKDVLLEGTESVKFTLLSVSATEGVVLGDKKELKLSFDAILSEGGSLVLQGRTEESNYANFAFVDFSTNTQVSIDRKSWSLGFYCGDRFRVFLNPAMQMAAAATDKTDLSAVSSADLDDLPSLEASMMTAEFISLDNVDDLAGDITKTVFAEVSQTDSENKVYVATMEDPETSKIGYYKIRVLRNDAGYKVEYALLDGTEVNTVEVAKDGDYNMVGVSFKDKKKIIPIEPKAKNWDIVWSFGTGPFSMGGEVVAFYMQDIISLNNLGGAEAVQVMGSVKDDYPKFTLDDAKALTFEKARNVIGTNWRATARMSGYTGPLGALPDRFYVVKDPAGNYYKLKFGEMGVDNDGGVRGNPKIEYALLK